MMKTVPEFLAHAVVLEEEAADRYDELADAMHVHNNEPVAELFRRMAGFSRMHAAEAVKRAEKTGPLPDIKPWEYEWPGSESPESAALDDSHYLMTPNHALRMALAAEQTAYRFYADVAQSTRTEEVRELAETFAEEEAGHVVEIEKWLARYPEADENWDDDPDPPVAAD